MTKHCLTLEFGSRAALMSYLLATANIPTDGGAVVANGNGMTNDDADDSGPADPNAPTVDSRGFPWDERIHSSNKKMTEKGVWRAKRNVSDITVEQVETELKSKMAQQPAAQQPMQQMPQTAGQMMPTTMPANIAAPMQQMPTMQAPPAQMPQMMPTTMPAAQPMPQMQAPDFGIFMASLSKAMQTANPATGQPYVDPAYLASICGWQQISDIGALASSPEKIPGVIQQFKTDGRWLD